MYLIEATMVNNSKFDSAEKFRNKYLIVQLPINHVITKFESVKEFRKEMIAKKKECI